MYRLEITEDAEDDLRRLKEEDEEAYFDLVAFLEEIKDSQDLLDALTAEGYSDVAISDVSQIINLQRRHFNVWRVKLYGLDPASSGIRRRTVNRLTL